MKQPVYKFYLLRGVPALQTGAFDHQALIWAGSSLSTENIVEVNTFLNYMTANSNVNNNYANLLGYGDRNDNQFITVQDCPNKIIFIRFWLPCCQF